MFRERGEISFTPKFNTVKGERYAGRKKDRFPESSDTVVLCSAPFRNGRALFLQGRGVWAQKPLGKWNMVPENSVGPENNQFCDKVCWARHLTNSAEYPG